MKGRRVDIDEEKFIENYLNGRSLTQLMKDFCISYERGSKILNNNNIKLRNYLKASPEKVVELYDSGETCANIAKKLSVCVTTIWIILRKNKTKRPYGHKKRFNQHYFDSIDTQEKAYFLGLIYGDGSISKPGKYATFYLGLVKEDKYLIEAFKKALESTHTITITKHNNINWQDRYNISIVNKHFTEQLIDKGVLLHKSHYLEFPTCLSKEKMSHFIRGYFDADGCIFKFRKFFRISVVGHKVFILGLQDYLKGMNIKVWATKHDKTSKTETYQLCCSAYKDSFVFAEMLYKNANIKMKRKYNKYLKYSRGLTSEMVTVKRRGSKG